MQPAEPQQTPEPQQTGPQSYDQQGPAPQPADQPAPQSYSGNGASANSSQPAYNPQFQQAPPAPLPEPPNPGLIILQWLTYAFWGWTVLALSVLTTTVISGILSDSDTNGFTTYGIAAVLVLLPLSYVLDSYYSKREPAQKKGAEIWVMIIHAVIFALFGIGALITAVISLVVLITSSADSTGSLVALISSLIVTVYYALTFVRTINPRAVSWIQTKYKMIMLVSVGVIALLGIIGPVAQERLTRDDKLVVAEMDNVSQAINNYAEANSRLPASLSELDLRGDAQKAIDKKLIEYRPEGRAPGVIQDTYDYSSSKSEDNFRYQLCATFTQESKNYSTYSSNDTSSDGSGYSSYLSVYEHPAGQKCYKLQTSY